MKVLKEGIIETSRCICDRCQAELEYTTKDIIGSTEIVPVDDEYLDWVDYPIIQDSWPEYVKDILEKYKKEYAASGYFATRNGYVECPCCGQKIKLGMFPVQTEVYPEEAIVDGRIRYDKTILIPGTGNVVHLLKKHYDEFMNQ